MDIVFTPDGTVRAVYAEDVDFAAFGRSAVTRASLGEPDDQARWFADLTPVSGPVFSPFDRRSETLAAVRTWLEAHWLHHSD